jgi:hypothetical protein
MLADESVLDFRRPFRFDAALTWNEVVLFALMVESMPRGRSAMGSRGEEWGGGQERG